MSPYLILTASALVITCEASALFLGTFLSPLESTLIIRCLEITGMVLLIKKYTGNHDVKGNGKAFCQYSGLSGNRLKKGVKCGLLWSLLFGAAVLMAGLSFFFITGSDPLHHLRFSLSHDTGTIFLFLLTGAMVSPIAEELFFRGIIYSYFRKYGVMPSVLISTLLFALCHFRGDNLPIVQIMGGILFALAFEYSGSIASPVIIHILGNMAIFSISLFF